MKSTPSLPSPGRGVTLVELLITIVVLAIVLAVAVPSFTQTIQNNRLATAANELVAALNTARAEALRRGVDVSVCSGTGSTCATTAKDNWSQGWHIFVDSTAPRGSIDTPADELLTSTTASEASIKAASNVGAVTFNARGAYALATFTVSIKGCSGDNQRKITVDTLGRISLTKENCPS